MKNSNSLFLLLFFCIFILHGCGEDNSHLVIFDPYDYKCEEYIKDNEQHKGDSVNSFAAMIYFNGYFSGLDKKAIEIDKEFIFGYASLIVPICRQNSDFTFFEAVQRAAVLLERAQSQANE